MLNLARERSLSMRHIVKNVCVIMRKQESLGSDGGSNGCIALQVRCRFPLVPNILFTRMQCDTSFRETFQDKDKLSANKLRSSGATISSFIILYVHTLFQQFTLLLSLLPLHGHISNLNISMILYDGEYHELDYFPSFCTCLCTDTVLLLLASSACIFVNPFYQIFKEQTNGIICAFPSQ